MTEPNTARDARATGRPPGLWLASVAICAAAFGLRLLFGGDDLAPLGAGLVLLGSYVALAGPRES